MQPWPDVVTVDPFEFERHTQRGADLHRLAQQHTLGIEPSRLAASIHDEVLAGWWQTFLAHPPEDLPHTSRWAEVVVDAPLAGYRLLAKFDLLAVDPGERAAVVDWKAVLNPPPRSVLAERLQTRVYRYLTVEAGTAYNGGQSVHPEQVEMIYWFAQRGGAVQRFGYDTGQHTADRDELAHMIQEIASRRDASWPLTPDERHCRFCQYRSLCERNVRPGFLNDLYDDVEPSEVEIDLEQIAEIEF
jgi:hypothetical protein